MMVIRLFAGSTPDCIFIMESFPQSKDIVFISISRSMQVYQALLDI